MSDTLIGHTAPMQYLLHRHDEMGDHWVLLTDEDNSDVYEYMENRVIDSGGQLYLVDAEVTVTKVKPLAAAEDEEEGEGDDDDASGDV